MIGRIDSKRVAIYRHASASVWWGLKSMQSELG